MDKKGVIWEELADFLLGGAILIAAIIFFIIMTGFTTEKESDYFEEEIIDVKDKELFISFLREEYTDDETFGDLLSEAVENSEKKTFIENFDMFLEEVYETKVCWKLYVGEEEWISKNICRTDIELLDSQIYVPTLNSYYKIRMNILGYAQ
ncbi:hypothetical protein GF327_06860 [Candidatus Woesearchaeota archaeon]|nr:hypothetical protein [Candidatus Woesearchaeota archaeon]